MSEYITVTPQATDNPDVMILVTNQDLTTEGREHYPDRVSGDEGSALAQFLFGGVEGLVSLLIEGRTLVVERDPVVEWHALIDEITEALKEFFL